MAPALHRRVDSAPPAPQHRGDVSHSAAPAGACRQPLRARSDPAVLLSHLPCPSSCCGNDKLLQRSPSEQIATYRFSISLWKLSGSVDQSNTSTRIGMFDSVNASFKSKIRSADISCNPGPRKTKSRSLVSWLSPLTRLPYAHTSTPGRCRLSSSSICWR